MEFLIIEGNSSMQVKGRELNSDELASLEAGDIKAFRFRGNLFEEATVSVRQPDIEHDVEEEDDSGDMEDDPIEYDVSWKTVDAA